MTLSAAVRLYRSVSQTFVRERTLKYKYTFYDLSWQPKWPTTVRQIFIIPPNLGKLRDTSAAAQMNASHWDDHLLWLV